MSNDLLQQAADHILEDLNGVHVNDRAGFLFGIVIGMLQEQGLDETGIRLELLKGLPIAYGRNNEAGVHHA